MTIFAPPQSSRLAVSAAVLMALSGMATANPEIDTDYSIGLAPNTQPSYHFSTDTTLDFLNHPAVNLVSPIEISTSDEATLRLNITNKAIPEFMAVIIGDPLTINGNEEISAINETDNSTSVTGLLILFNGSITTSGSLALNVKNKSGRADGIAISSADTNERTFGGALDVTVEAATNAYGITTSRNSATASPVTFAGPTTITATSTNGDAYGMSSYFVIYEFKGLTTIEAKAANGKVVGVSLDLSEISFEGQDNVISATSESGEGVGLLLGASVTQTPVYTHVTPKLTLQDNSTLNVTGSTTGIAYSTSNEIYIGKNASLTTNSMNSTFSMAALHTHLKEAAKLVVTGGDDTESNLSVLIFEGPDAAVEVGSGTYNIAEWQQGDNDATLRTTGDLSATQVTIDSKTGDGVLTLAATKEVNNQYDTVQDTAQALKAALTLPEGESYQLEVASGDVNDALTATVDEQGNLTDVVITRNVSLDAFSSIASLGIVSWRHEMNDLQKRLGELRMSPEGVGAWARLYGSEQEYGAQNVLSKSKSIQVGADTDIGDGWKVGGAFIYTDGDSHYDSGNADSDAYSLAVYGTWMDENGLFVDLIGKYTRMETDFKASSMSGSFDNNALSLSAEAGWHFKVNDQFFVEPQAELTWGRIKGDSFTASNGVKVKQDDTDSIIGRVGVRTGYYLPENKGTVYARLSGVYDFDGETANKASLGTSRNTFKKDLGGSWVEMGVGANYNVNDKAYVYADLQKTAGGEVKENWRWNVGMRYVF